MTGPKKTIAASALCAASFMIFSSQVAYADTPIVSENSWQTPAPRPKPILNAQLLRWDGEQERTTKSDDARLKTLAALSQRNRRTLYGANIYTVDLDLSVALKPKRLMSLDAAW